MTNQKNVCICGGGSLGHVIAGWLAHKGLNVSILTRHPHSWSRQLIINTPHGEIHGQIKSVSDNPAELIPEANVILLTVPGTANEHELNKIAPFINKSSFVGGVFCSSGFFFQANKILGAEYKLWGFQRVPFISRVEKYGYSANLLGNRDLLKIAIENTTAYEKEQFRKWVEDVFESNTELLNNFYEASITNSNPILHTARLYTMFHDWNKTDKSAKNILFYEEWNEEASKLMIAMDKELFAILKHLPVDRGYLKPLLEYYESNDAASMTAKLKSIAGFKGITSPMKEVDGGWVPDYANRYFTEDFGFSLRYIWELGKKYGVLTPNIDKVYEWGKVVSNTPQGL